MDQNSEKLDALSDRIRAAEAKPEVESEPSPQRNIGFDFVGSVLGGGILGAGLDYAFRTSPWCLLGMVLFGFAVGIFSAWRVMQSKE